MEDRLAVIARDVGVEYDLRLTRRRTLRRALGELFERTRNDGDDHARFWALKSVTFELRQGEILGVIGRNGSGKSTLLLTLAGVLRPDTGNVTTDGRATLLTLGAGFENDLTGRENVYLNGAFFGLPKRRIDELLEPILEFSELGAFADVPLRKYSTGMRARLGFSIAAHIEPDILLLDEVLGVGDAAFQRKSLAKIRELLTRARAIVVVTHSPAFVTDVCTRALWLEDGRVAGYGPSDEIVARYVEDSTRDKGPVRSVGS